MITITVFDGSPITGRYRVCINNDVYAMSPDADSPQGVNQYVGVYVRPAKYGGYGQKLPGIPACILSAVFRRAMEVKGENEN